MFTVSYDDRAVSAQLSTLPAEIHAALLTKMSALTLALEQRVKDKLSGQVLNVKTGALRASIFSQIVDTPDRIEGSVFSNGSVKYAAIHEYGGKTAAHDIIPTKAQALAFVMEGKQVFAKIVHHPGSKIPERSYMRSSLHEMEGEIVGGIAGVVAVGLDLRK